MENLGQTIRERRKVLGMTQEQLADRMHVSRQTVSHWETGRVIPDVESLRMLAEILDFRFTLGSDAEEKIPGDETDSDHEQVLSLRTERKKLRQKRLWWISLVALLVVAVVAAILVISREPKTAEIIVTPQDGETYMFYDTQFGSGAGWDVPFTFENVSDVPFCLDHIECRFYEGDVLCNIIIVPLEQIKPFISSPWMRQGDYPLCWPFGTDHLYLTEMECIVYGTDANGNELHFSGRVRLLPAAE